MQEQNLVIAISSALNTSDITLCCFSLKVSDSCIFVVPLVVKTISYQKILSAVPTMSSYAFL